MKSLIDVAAKILFVALAVVMIFKLLDRDALDQRIAVARQERMMQIEDLRKYAESRLNRLQSDLDAYQIISDRSRRMQEERIDMLSRQLKETKSNVYMLNGSGNGNSKSVIAMPAPAMTE